MKEQQIKQQQRKCKEAIRRMKLENKGYSLARIEHLMSKVGR